MEKLDEDEVESLLPNGPGSVKAWIQTVEGLEAWEKNLNLGDAYLKTSAKSKLARARFTLGLLCLHNFMYDLAIELFEKAQSDELTSSGRDYPMALWGSTASTTMILWQYSDCKKGKEYLKKIPVQRNWLTKMESAFLETGFALYPNDLSCSEDSDQFRREKRFMTAMKNVMKRFPDEVEAKLFYGVSYAATLGHKEFLWEDVEERRSLKSQKEIRLKQIRQLFGRMYKKHPTHSGIIHYVIHIFDIPDVFNEGNKKFLHRLIKPEDQARHAASFGIKASYDYLKIATSSCHGLHMPSHIFMRLGNWNMSLTSNLNSIKV